LEATISPLAIPGASLDPFPNFNNPPFPELPFLLLSVLDPPEFLEPQLLIMVTTTKTDEIKNKRFAKNCKFI
jgi:hypothetical protein